MTVDLQRLDNVDDKKTKDEEEKEASQNITKQDQKELSVAKEVVKDMFSGSFLTTKYEKQ